MKFLILPILVFFYIVYKRYFPVFGVQSNHIKDLKLDDVSLLDVRDYNESDKKQINGATNIPIAYLERHSNEIPKSQIHLVASNFLEKNMGIRFLRKKGFKVVSYTIVKPNKFILKKNSIEKCC